MKKWRKKGEGENIANQIVYLTKLKPNQARERERGILFFVTFVNFQSFFPISFTPQPIVIIIIIINWISNLHQSQNYKTSKCDLFNRIFWRESMRVERWRDWKVLKFTFWLLKFRDFFSMNFYRNGDFFFSPQSILLNQFRGQRPRIERIILKLKKPFVFFFFSSTLISSRIII